MKKILGTLILALVSAASAAALPLAAQVAESIRSFRVEAVVNADSSVKVTERVAYDFGTEPRHGIVRDIPVKYETPYGNQSLKLADVSVVDERGNQYEFEVSDEGRYKRIRIGDPDVFVTGEMMYVISYRAERALGYFDNYDELYWNATGNEWGVPIESASARVTLPVQFSEGTLRSSCYQGSFGSSESCEYRFEPIPGGIAAEFSATRQLGSGEGLTVAFGFPKGVIVVPSSSQEVLDFVRDNPVILLPFFVFVAMFCIWRKYGKDPKGRTTIIPEYEVPGKLSPLEVSMIVYQGVRTSAISAEIVNLAVKGYMTIERIEENRRFLLDTVDYIFKKNLSGESSNETDRMLIDKLFGHSNEVKLSNLKHKFYKNVPMIKKKATESVVAKGYYAKSPDSIRTVFVFITIGIAFIIGALFEWLGLVAIITSVLSAVIIGAFTFFMPKLTKRGAETRDAILGLKDYLQIAEKDRLKFHNAPEKNPKLFEKLLPYAMTLGVEETWAKEFADLHMNPPSWYHGAPGTFNAVAFTNDLSSFNTAVATNMASAPGSSSGSGGGGFSGGGGGGGGGGSW